MSNLLDKASIILTPTAYNNGEALCVKPSDGSGDFDFSRNSAATRVNAQGLVENVQILSSNLVQNGDFSEEGVQEVSNGSFSQEGVEVSSDVNFDNPSNWTLTGQSTVSNGVAHILQDDTANTGVIANTTITNKTYRITGVVSDYVSGSVGFSSIGSTSPREAIPSQNGEFTIYYTSTRSTPSTWNIQRIISPCNLKIDNVSVREVGQDWDLSSQSEIVEDAAKVVSTDGSFQYIKQNGFTSTQGKTIKFTIEVTDIQIGQLKVSFTGGTTNTNIPNSVGTHILYIPNDGSIGELTIGRVGGITDISITNISVKEVAQNWDLGTGWSIGNNIAISDATQGYIIQTDVGGAGVTATYKIQWTQNITAGTRLRFFARNYNDGASITTLSITRDDGVSISGGNCIGSGTFTAYVSSTNGYSFKLLAEAGVEADITNITTIQITTDTNLPRINYEGFSYQDVLGSELVLNGTFDNGSANWTVAGGNPIFENSSVNFVNFSTINSNNTVVELGKTYKITYTISNKVGNSSFGFFLGGWNVAQYQDVGTHSEIISVSSSSVIYIRNGNSNSSVTIDNVSVKEYLGQEVVPDSGCGSWLWEPQTTQILPYSEDFSQFSIVGTITLESGYLAPDGTNTAYKVSGDGGLYLVSSVSATSARSIYAKTVSGTGTATLLSHPSNTNNVFTLTEEWQRFELNSSPAVATTFYPVDFRGSGTLSEIILWGANATNDQDYATSYIPSNGSTVTRNQDVCTNGGSLASVNSTEGVIYWEGAMLQAASGTQVLGLSDGSGANRIGFQTSATANQIRFVVDAGGSQASEFFVLDDITNFNKLALKWKQDDFSFWVNGIKIGTDTSGNVPPLNALNTLDFYYGTGIFNFFAKTKALAVWKEALSDQELTELTTI